MHAVRWFDPGVVCDLVFEGSIPRHPSFLLFALLPSFTQDRVVGSAVYHRAG